MKIFEVVKIAETLDIKQVGGVWRIIDTKTGDFVNKPVYDSPGEAESARDKMKLKLSAKNDNTKNTKPEKFGGKTASGKTRFVPGTKIDPPVIDPKNISSGDSNSIKKEPQLKSDPTKPKAPAGKFPPGTPTMDQLSGYKQRKLGATPTSGLKPGKFNLIKRTGEVEYKGKTYTLAQVKAATAADDAAKVAAQSTQGLFGKTMGLTKSLVGKVLKIFTFPGIGFVLNSVWNATQLEEEFDSYLREIQRHAKTLKPQERAVFVKDLINEKSGTLPFKVEGAYLRCIEKSAEILFKMVVGALVAVAALSGKVGVAAIIGFLFPAVTTAWITVPVGIVIGAAYVIGGTAAIEKLVDSLGGMDVFENMLMPILNPKAVVSLAKQTDSLQEIFGLQLDVLDAIPGLSLIVPDGDLVRDVPKNESTLQEKQTSSADAKRKVLALVKSDPNIQDAYLAGKDEAKKVVKGNLKSLKKVTGEAT